MTPKLEPLTELTPKEAAAALGVAPSTVYRWMESGQVRYRHIGQRYYLLWQDLAPMADVHEADGVER